MKKKLISIPTTHAIETSDLAYRVTTEQNKILWVPKSQVESFKIQNGVVSFWAPLWLIREKEIENFIDTSYEPSLFG